MPPKTAQHKKRSSFTLDEDDRLRNLVLKYGETSWYQIATKMPKRNTRQCRERWMNYLSPRVVNGPWSVSDDDMLELKVVELGRSWKAMENFFPGRTDINIKNRWNFLQAKKTKTPSSVPSRGAPAADTTWLLEIDMPFGCESGDTFTFDMF